jgi:hypothetical protein
MYTHLNDHLTAQSEPLASAAARFIDELSMDVLVQSFNRPYSLDRCLCSLRQHVRKVRSIRVLDDGTPGKYLDEIKRRHPQIEIRYSERHAAKAAAIEHYRAGDPYPAEVLSPLPWELWRTGVQAASPRFLLLADGQWCVREMDLGGIGQVMKSRGCAMVRLFKNPTLDRAPVTPLSPEICQVHPWILKSRLHTLFYKICLAHRLGIADHRATESLYVGHGIFERSFWLEVTRDTPNDASENLLQTRALEWASHHRRAAFARTTSDPIATTVRSPASNDDLGRAVGFDMILFNKLLNEYWFAGRLDPCAGLPGDFPEETILAVLAEAGEPSCTPEKWSLWCDQMKEKPMEPR